MAIETEPRVEEVEREPPARIRVVRLLAFALVPLIFVSFIGYTLFKTEPPKGLLGSELPDFSLPRLGGGAELSSAQLAGGPIVINFWASWCIPCREEAKVLEAAWKKYGPQGVTVLGVNVQDSEEDAEAFAKEFGITYPIVRDTDLTLWTKLGVSGLPETFFVDSEGVFFGVGSGEQVDHSGATKILGAIDPALLDSQIQLMLKGRDAQP